MPVFERNGLVVSPATVLAVALLESSASEFESDDGRALVEAHGTTVGGREVSLEAEVRSFVVRDDVIEMTISPTQCYASGINVGLLFTHFYDNPITVRVIGVAPNTLQYTFDAADGASGSPTLAQAMDVTLNGDGTTLSATGRKCMCCDGAHAVDAACTTKLCDQSGTCRGATGTCTWIDMGGPAWMVLLGLGLFAALRSRIDGRGHQ